MTQTPPLRVVITGASSGIGAATALAFADDGAHLVLAARGQAALEQVAQDCRDRSGTAHVHVVDTTDAGAVAALAADAVERLGGIDLWFSCVGIGVLGRFVDTPVADHARVVDANLTSHINDAHAVLPIFLAQDRGTWVNMISVAAFVATPYAAAYAASKFGLRGFSEALRGEMSRHPHIHICDVYPIFVDTPGVDHAGNYTGARPTLPPGALSPDTVARKVVRLAKHPRNTTTVGAPAIALKLGQFAVPNLTAAIVNGFLDSWTARAPAGEDRTGSLYAPDPVPSGADGGRRDPAARRTAGYIGTGLLLATLAGGVWLATASSGARPRRRDR